MFSIATWNINSVRLRLPLVEHFLREHRPDVLCLQEIKCQEEQFPLTALQALGYEHIAMHGQKGYHGVATVSLHPLEDVMRQDFCAVGDARHLSVRLRFGSGICASTISTFRPAATSLIGRSTRNSATSSTSSRRCGARAPRPSPASPRFSSAI